MTYARRELPRSAGSFPRTAVVERRFPSFGGERGPVSPCPVLSQPTAVKVTEVALSRSAGPMVVRPDDGVGSRNMFSFSLRTETTKKNKQAGYTKIKLN